VIIYGRKGSLFAPRTWYLFRTFGHDRVGLMQGSLEDWVDHGGPVDTDPMSYNLWAKDLVVVDVDGATASQANFNYRVPSQVKANIVDMNAVLEIIRQGQATKVAKTNDDNVASAKKGDENSEPSTTTTAAITTVIVDTRGSSFAKKGHMPGAIHIPYSSLVEPDNSLVLKSTSELQTILKSKGLDPASPCFPRVLLSCGTGVSVCHMALVLEECGCDPPPLVYDGSWNEWKMDPSTPKIIPVVE
jgi:thiosulfate/3-mercaptopyruvate sulfurtransferase